ncbi:tyrosine-protein phosphatase non-receptor type 21-like [Xenia sp. Carnegie-2017]|uniref:tyrosine-protein phosphatase non-receptor type 21-like n=1 Tax=Xenia sp. Carnegie-2017 TaxID=2897299 RepID=UPI001F03F293|nr:tyrosine-protein phosphatase non-receptor type 21-like [Xenia sp. Carnegie-2017]
MDTTAVPNDFLMASYKTFSNQSKSIDSIQARRSLPCASSNIDAERRNERSFSMIVPTRLERSGDACSLQTLATSGYNTSADSELSSSKSPVSPISPVSLISTSSFPYHSYEVPDADTQCKQLETVLNKGDLGIEFDAINLRDENKSTTTASLSENSSRNRCSDILPYEESRVRLDSSKNSSKNDYVNASFVKVKVSNKPFFYIATQAPTEATVSDFVQMIWEQDAKIIVMLYNKKGGQQECFRYWPKDSYESNELTKLQFGEFELMTQFVNKSTFYKSRSLKLHHRKTHQDKTVILFQFCHWPQHGVPGDASIFLDFISQVDSLRSNYIPDSDKYSPMVVQCRLGDGRTGVFILANLMIAHLQTSTRQPYNVPRILSKLRSQRMCLVRTVEQYRFVYILLIQYLKNSRLI